MNHSPSRNKPLKKIHNLQGQQQNHQPLQMITNNPDLQQINNHLLQLLITNNPDLHAKRVFYEEHMCLQKHLRNLY